MPAGLRNAGMQDVEPTLKVTLFEIAYILHDITFFVNLPTHHSKKALTINSEL